MENTDTTKTLPETCPDCGWPREHRACVGCGVEADVIDCGHSAQPVEIAASKHNGDPVCEDCEAVRDEWAGRPDCECCGGTLPPEGSGAWEESEGTCPGHLAIGETRDWCGAFDAVLCESRESTHGERIR